MAAFNNVIVSGDTWVNINTLSGAAVGSAINIQNIGLGACLLQESNTMPTEDKGGLLFPPMYDSLSKAIVAAGSETMWAKLKGSGTTTLAVYE